MPAEKGSYEGNRNYQRRQMDAVNAGIKTEATADSSESEGGQN